MMELDLESSKTFVLLRQVNFVLLFYSTLSTHIQMISLIPVNQRQQIIINASEYLFIECTRHLSKYFTHLNFFIYNLSSQNPMRVGTFTIFILHIRKLRYREVKTCSRPLPQTIYKY